MPLYRPRTHDLKPPTVSTINERLSQLAAHAVEARRTCTSTLSAIRKERNALKARLKRTPSTEPVDGVRGFSDSMSNFFVEDDVYDTADYIDENGYDENGR